MIAEYLTAAVEDENPDVLLLALANVAKARGMAQVAKAAGLGRESLYKTLAPGSHPRFETIAAVMRALSVKMAVRGPETAKAEPKSVTIDAFRRGLSLKAEPRTLTIDDFFPIKPAKREPSLKAETMGERAAAKKGAARKQAAKRPAKQRA